MLIIFRPILLLKYVPRRLESYIGKNMAKWLNASHLGLLKPRLEHYEIYFAIPCNIMPQKEVKNEPEQINEESEDSKDS